MSEVLAISILTIISVFIQILINLYFEWRRQKREDIKLKVEQQKHKEEMALAKERFRLDKRELRRQKYQDYLNYNSRITELQQNYMQTMIMSAEKVGIDLKGEDIYGQVEDFAQRTRRSEQEHKRKSKKQELREKRSPKKAK